MKRSVSIVLVVLATIMAGTALHAEDINWITIQNEFQATLVGSLVDHAYTRDGNRFLAGLTPEQAELIRASGIKVDVVARDIDPSRTYHVMADGHAAMRRSDLTALGTTVDLGDGKMLLSGGYAAASLIEDARYVVRPLERLNTRWLYLPPAVATGLAEATDFPSDTLVDLVSQDSIYAMDQRLMDFQTRYYRTDSIIASLEWMEQKFLDWGYTDVSYQTFVYNGTVVHNLVVVKEGSAEPDKLIVVGGHYDSINLQGDAMVFAPGADDNGSGTAGVMEMARVLKDVPLRKTVIFMPFTAEEVGLIGSDYAAQQFVNSGADVEVMYNFDMIGYDPSDLRQISLSGASFNNHYRDFTSASAARVTDLSVVPENSPGGSDHQSFLERGFPIVFAIESDFNFGGWHTNLDITSRMNFPYFTKVVKMGLASLAVVADAAHPTEIAAITDQGDGQALEIFWTDCDPTYTYRLFWGQTPGVYTDSIDVVSGACSQVVSGLTEGVPYFFSVVGEAPDGYPAIYAVEDSLTPLIIPRAPRLLVASPTLDAISLDWADSPEADLAAYRIYRSIEGMPFILYRDGIATSTFTDTGVVGQTRYDYLITAVDNDGYESSNSESSGSWPATFDGGILIADEITLGVGVPTDEAQAAFFDTIFGETPFEVTHIEEDKSALSRGEAGQFSSIFWFDDDLARKIIDQSEDTLDWFAGYQTNLFVCGQRTIQFWGSSIITPGDIRYDEFGLQAYVDNSAFDFAGAHGQAGWPDLEVDLTNFFGLLPNIPTLTPTAGTTVIYTYDADSDDPSREGVPVGLLKQTANGYRVLLAFPATFLTTASATALIDYTKGVFGESGLVQINGDVDGSGTINIADISYLVAFLFQGAADPANPNGADCDGTCNINVSDLTYLVAFVFQGGPDPLPGCVQ